MEHRDQDKASRPATGGSFLVRDVLHEDIPGICAVMPEEFGPLGGAPWADPGYVAQGLECCGRSRAAGNSVAGVPGGA
ncbi:hypothetical protein OHA98_20725 [Streptomyces sp. NBC_00654]|uniref:hypothetical protein n=1 Tax=Streptomyces sp. NBC_00654 TaxID=2975799 RepID=UPI00225453C1|nr:hypothetical protein [Streptomyces sp. NBC_00654]MCX4967165.1 hypothetical protein [Streptomyces sp. NBC_00654]